MKTRAQPPSPGAVACAFHCRLLLHQLLSLPLAFRSKITGKSEKGHFVRGSDPLASHRRWEQNFPPTALPFLLPAAKPSASPSEDGCWLPAALRQQEPCLPTGRGTELGWADTGDAQTSAQQGAGRRKTLQVSQVALPARRWVSRGSEAVSDVIHLPGKTNAPFLFPGLCCLPDSSLLNALHGNLGGWDPLEASLADAQAGVSTPARRAGSTPSLAGSQGDASRQPALALEPLPGSSLLPLSTQADQPQAHHAGAVALSSAWSEARRDQDLRLPSWHGWVISSQQQADRMSHCTLWPLCLL